MRLIFIKKGYSVHGGAENYARLTIEQLKKKHEVHIFAHNWAETAGIHFHRVDANNLSSFMSVLSFNRNVCALLRTVDSDCIISFERTTCQDIYRAGEGCHAEWLDIRKKIEPVWKRSSFRLNPLHLSILKIEKKLFTSTERIIANSNMVKNQIMRHYGIPHERITLIYNGVDLKRFRPENRHIWNIAIRERLAIPKDSVMLLFVGSGFKRKGLGTLMKAVSLARRQDIVLMVIGGDDISAYKKLADSYGISERVHFQGIQGEIEQFYAAADIFILPTLYDPFSNATLEAMASGLPVITTKNNGASELIENAQEGFVLEDLFDAEELADKINLTMRNLTVMGQRARKKAEGFSIEKVADEFTGVIEHLVNIKSSRGQTSLDDIQGY